MLILWASWCIPCKDEAPYLEQAWHSRRDDGVVVVGLDAKDFRSDARRFADRFDLHVPARLRRPGPPLDGYNATGFPEKFVIDREGASLLRLRVR